MNEHEHFKRFKRLHKQSMLAEQRIERPHVQQNGHSTKEKMQEIKHLPDQLPRKRWLREWLRRWWLLMAPKQEGKYSISQPLAIAILSVLCGIGSVGWWRSADKIDTQHDEIIRLQTKLELQSSKDVKQDDEIAAARATAQIADRNAARLEGKFDQFSLQFAGKKKPVDLTGEN